jgi:hypothetical protein
MLRKLSPVGALLVLLLAGCPEEVGLSCPPGATSVGQFVLNFAGQHPAGECVAVSVDGGDAGIGPLALEDGGEQSANVCFGLASDGGPQVSLVIPSKGVRFSSLGDGGSFDFTGNTAPTPGTGCICPVGISEDFAGNLVGLTADAGFALQSDGGLPVVAGLNATVKDTLTMGTAGDLTCICSLPCTVTYAITGTR